MFYYIYQFEISPMWNGNPIKLKTEMLKVYCLPLRLSYLILPLWHGHTVYLEQFWGWEPCSLSVWLCDYYPLRSLTTERKTKTKHTNQTKYTYTPKTKCPHNLQGKSKWNYFKISLVSRVMVHPFKNSRTQETQRQEDDRRRQIAEFKVTWSTEWSRTVKLHRESLSWNKQTNRSLVKSEL